MVESTETPNSATSTEARPLGVKCSDLLEGWTSIGTLPVDTNEPVLLLCQDDQGFKWQYVCWPPCDDTGWLMLLADDFDHDLHIAEAKGIKAIGWMNLPAC